MRTVQEQMDDNNKNGAQDSVIHLSASLWNIPDLPFEIICSFLDTSSLINLSLTCIKFNSFIKNVIPLREWKKRAKDIWSDAVYPILSPANPNKLFWRMSCEALQKQKVLWTQNPNSLVKIVKEKYGEKEGYGFSVSLLLMNAKLTLLLKEISTWFEHNEIYKMENAHHKRIRGLTIIDNEIYSCSTDNKPIKSWKLNNGHLQMETSYNFDLSNDEPTCLSSYLGQNVFAVGSDCGCVTVYDARSKDPMGRYEVRYPESGKSFFRRWICKLEMNSKYILTGSSDNTISVCDLRTAKIMKHITMPDNVSCIKIEQDCVFIGDTYGKLHILNPKNDFELVKSYDIGHTLGIKGVHLTYGSLITSSTDKVIISSSTDAPKHMYTLNISSSIRRMDYQNGTLALSDYDDVVRIYRLVQ